MAVALRVTALAAVVLAIALGGCGGGGEDTTSAQTTTTSQSAESQSSGGEASIEEFGSEAEGSEREAILGVFTGYLNAITDEDYATACADLSAPLVSSLVRLGGGSSKPSCPQALPRLLAPSAKQIARQQADGEVTKVRVEEDRAFVVFKAPGAELYQQTMVAEGGEWKAATLAAAVLVPEL